jgi:SAM-dependent methyltransferase
MSNPQPTNFLEAIRLSELTQIDDLLESMGHKGASILEIGAGTGWQARELASRGYQVSAIDIPSSNHSSARIWPIMDFDGRHIPFPDASFDVVYSSNVLEHVEDMETLNREMVRVLRPGGRAIHYVPTRAWRAWSLAAFYPSLVRDVWRRLFSPKVKQAPPVATENPSTPLPVPGNNPSRPLLQKVLRRLVPHAHGAEGSCWSELTRFARPSWDRYFTSAGWVVEDYRSNGLFLTGEMLMGGLLPTTLRTRLSKYFGSTAHLYVLKRM